MSVHDPAVTLRQIQDAGRRAQEICASRTLEVLNDDWQARAALERFIEILGEAVKRLPADLCARHPEVPWKEISGTRDRLIHGYDDIHLDIVWKVTTEEVPVLSSYLDAHGKPT